MKYLTKIMMNYSEPFGNIQGENKKGEWAFLFNSRNLAFWARALHLLN